MEFAAIGLVVLVLVVFFVLKKKKTIDLEGTAPSLEPPRKGASPQPREALTPPTPATTKEPVRADAATEDSDGASQDKREPPQADVELEGVSSSRDDSEESDTLEGRADSEEDDTAEPSVVTPEEASPPPPPARDKGTPAPPTVGRKSELQSLRKGLAKSRAGEGFFGRLKDLFGGAKEIDPDIAGEIEEVLLTSDVGVKTTEAILDRIKDSLTKGELSNEAQVWEALRDEARRTLSVDGRMGGVSIAHKPTVILFVGVNGAGKTTTIGKLAQQFIGSGKTVVLAAGDTFRAAAVDQLKAWGERVGCEVVSGKDGADPSSVLFDAIDRAQEIGADVLLADTAGRLHTKTNLMQEMTKISKTLSKALPGAPHEVLLVIDSTNGQNAMAQAREFKEALNVTGLVLTKLDGTARGGAVLGICDGLQLPVRYIGIGEKTEDLLEFDTNAFVEALLGSDENDIAA